MRSCLLLVHDNFVKNIVTWSATTSYILNSGFLSVKLVALGATKAVVEGRPVSVWYTMNQSSWVWPWNCAVTVLSNLLTILPYSLAQPGRQLDRGWWPRI